MIKTRNDIRTLTYLRGKNRRDDGVFKTNVKSSADDVKNWRRERRRAEESTSKKKMWKIEDVKVNI